MKCCFIFNRSQDRNNQLQNIALSHKKVHTFFCQRKHEKNKHGKKFKKIMFIKSFQKGFSVFIRTNIALRIDYFNLVDAYPSCLAQITRHKLNPARELNNWQFDFSFYPVFREFF